MRQICDKMRPGEWNACINIHILYCIYIPIYNYNIIYIYIYIYLYVYIYIYILPYISIRPPIIMEVENGVLEDVFSPNELFSTSMIMGGRVNKTQ